MNTTQRIPNAYKWTEARVTEELAAIKFDAVSEDVDYLGIALIRQGLYIQLWAYWKKIFTNNDDIIEQMMLIESIFEARLVQGALRKKISPGIAMFALKNNHHWSDKPPVEKMIQDDSMVVHLDRDTLILASSDHDLSGTYRRSV